MSESGTDPTRLEIRSVRRLARLFRIEYHGGFDRRPVADIGRLVERRNALVAALLTTDLQRRALAVQPTTELDQAIAELSGEVDRALPWVHTRLKQIGKDLQLSRGEGWSTGIRDNSHGHALGKT